MKLPEMTTPIQNHIADYLILDSREVGELLTNLKLQKLLYYAQAWYLALYDKALFSEDFQAWVHGPVLLSQYHRFKDYQWHPIMDEKIATPANLGEHITDHLDEVLQEFGSETAYALEQMTHNEEPWLAARGDLPPHEPSNAKIDKTIMQKFYKSLLNDKNQESKA